MTDPSICSKYLKIKEQKTIQRRVIQTHKQAGKLSFYEYDLGERKNGMIILYLIFIIPDIKGYFEFFFASTIASITATAVMLTMSRTELSLSVK